MPPPNKPKKNLGGRPPKDPSITAEGAIREVAEMPNGRANPILALVDAARHTHRLRKFAPTSRYLDAIQLLAEACEENARQPELPFNPADTCDCGHVRAQHPDGGYCIACLYRLEGMGWNGCRAFHPPEQLPDVEVACACGRKRIGYKRKMRDADYPRTHVHRDDGNCTEDLPNGMTRELERVTP